MEKFKSLSILVGKFILFVLLGAIFVSIMYYFFFNEKVVSILSLIYMVIVFFIFGFKSSKKIDKGGYKMGLKIGIIFTIILVLINIIIYHNFHLSNLIYYLILILASTIGGMMGINKK